MFVRNTGIQFSCNVLARVLIRTQLYRCKIYSDFCFFLYQFQKLFISRIFSIPVSFQIYWHDFMPKSYEYLDKIKVLIITTKQAKILIHGETGF